jgi:hypothetical protein
MRSPVIWFQGTQAKFLNTGKIVAQAGMDFARQVFVDGITDEIQLLVQGNATQTSDIAVFEKSDGTDLLQVTNTAGTKIRGTTTNDAAAAGFVGEILTQSRVRSAALNRTTGQSGTAFNVTATALTLTAGDWDLEASITVEDGGAGTNITSLAGSTSLTSATLATADAIGVPNANGEVTMALKYSSLVLSGQTALPLGRHIVTVANATTAVFFLACTPTFTVNSLNVWGYLSARRVR